jgi:hypothetical protein
MLSSSSWYLAFWALSYFFSWEWVVSVMIVMFWRSCLRVAICSYKVLFVERS